MRGALPLILGLLALGTGCAAPGAGARTSSVAGALTVEALAPAFDAFAVELERCRAERQRWPVSVPARAGRARVAVLPASIGRPVELDPEEVSRALAARLRALDKVGLEEPAATEGEQAYVLIDVSPAAPYPYGESRLVSVHVELLGRGGHVVVCSLWQVMSTGGSPPYQRPR